MASYGAVEEIVYEMKALIALKNGTTVAIASEDMQQYSASSTLSSQCIPVGATSAMSFSMSFNNTDYKLTAAELDGAKVTVSASMGSGSSNWKPFGVWYVDSTDISEQNPFATVSGYDALETKFEANWTDVASDYPRTLLLIMRAVCAAAGVTLATTSFHNATYSRSKKPDWGDSCTLRDVVSYIAACAAGFARINYSGELEICTVGAAGKHSATSDYYSELSLSGGFTFNCLEYKFESDDEGEDAEYTRYAINSGIADNASNTIQMSGNPLVTEWMANDIAQTLKGVSYEGASLMWFGGLEVLPGDDLTLTDTSGTSHKLILTSHTMDLGGGISANSMSDMPSSLSQTEGYSSGNSVFNSDGSVNVEAVSGLNKKIVSANIGYFEELTAEDVHASKLLAALLEATNLWAKNIEAGQVTADSLTAAVTTVIEGYFEELTAGNVHASEVLSAIIKATKLWAENIESNNVTTDNLTAAMAAIINATIQKITAGTTSTDELYAAMAEITALKVGSLTAPDITADRLGAALAAFTVMTAGTAQFDQATVQHLVAQAMNLSFGTMGEVFIENLRVAYAQMVSATIGNLCIKASDGNYYTIDVDENGNVTAAAVTVSAGEITAGQTDAGKVILETDITAESLNTANLLATYALVNRIDAARIDVDQLFSREGFIDKLTTSTLYNDTSIQMLIGRDNEMSRWFTFDNETGFTIRKPAYTDADGMEHKGSIWRFVAVETGIRVYRADLADPVLSAEKDRILAPKVQIGNMMMRASKRGTIVFQHVD